jgi:glycosyltransferase involved in cell wall biosynthesis
MDIRPYRIPFLERIERRDTVELTVYAGAAAAGFGAPEEPPAVAVKVRPIKNHFWPHNRLKVWWQTGALAVLTDESEVIVLPELVSNPTLWVIRLFHRFFRKELVLQGFFYRPDHAGWLEPARTQLRRFLRASASAFVPYTDQGRQELLRDGVDGSMIFVNGNTLDTAHLATLRESVTPSERNGILEEFGVPENAVVFAFLGRLRPIKRVGVAFEAVRLLNLVGERSYFLMVIGDGPESGPLAALPGDHVRMLGQIYDERRIAQIFSVCSLLVLPGSVGLTCVHGFANGLPCVTSSDAAVTQTPEFTYVEDGVNGVVLPAPDPELYADALREIVSDSDRLNSLREGALATAKRLDMDDMVESFVAAIVSARRHSLKRRDGRR